jgi:chromosome segregation ATPase
MEKGSKLIIIALALLLLISLIFIYQVNSSRQNLVNKYKRMEKTLSEKNASLESQLEKVNQERRRLQEKIASVQDKIEKVATERDEWRKRYEETKKTKEELLKQLKAKPTVVERPVAVKPQITDQEHWAKVLEDKAALEVRLGELDKMLKDSQFQLEELKNEKADLKLQVTALKQEKNELERQLRYNQQIVANLSRELVREKTDRAAVIEQIDKIKQENLSLRRQVKELSSAKLSLEKGLKKLEDEKDRLAERIASTEEVLKSRMKELLKIKRDLETSLGMKPSELENVEAESVELPPIVVRAGTDKQSTQPSTTPIKGKLGKVVSLNEANNFVIIDIGEDNGVKIGDVFRIYRDNNHIATVEVIQTRKDISAADIKYQKQKIFVGDIVSAP